MKIRIIKAPLTQYQTKGQVDENTPWIREFLGFEKEHGAPGGNPHPTWGWNNPRGFTPDKKGLFRDKQGNLYKGTGKFDKPKTIEEAEQLFREQYLPDFINYPLDLRKRLADYSFNTGRNVNDLLLYNADKITLDQLNGPNVFTNEWTANQPEIEKMYSDPNFISKLDSNKENVYKTTGTYDIPDPNDSTKTIKKRYSLTNPNPEFRASWLNRINLFRKPKTSAVNAAPVTSMPASTPAAAPVAKPTLTPTTIPTRKPVTYPTAPQSISNNISNVLPATATAQTVGTGLNNNQLVYGANPFVVTQADTDQADLAANSTSSAAAPISAPVAAPSLPASASSSIWNLGQTPNVPMPRVTTVNANGTRTTTGSFGTPTVQYQTYNQGTPVTGNPPIVNPNPNKGPLWQRAISGTINLGMKGVSGLLNNPVANTLGKIGNTTQKITNVATPILNYFDTKKKDAANLDHIREMNMAENLYFDPTKYRGDWDQEGIFRPNELGFDSKGEYVNATYGPTTYAQYGGTMLNDTDMKRIKIKITGGPQQNMAYGGQSNYGLDLGQRNVYDTMADLRSESVSNTLSEVPREEANIEAEGGETVYGDLDGDGGLEHSKIVGKRHTQGGVPLNVPEGSFIFSDTKKMKIKDPEVLKAFGLNAKSGGYTPAEIAKRYDINKYKAVLEDQYSDDMSKATAQLMIKNYQKKLGMLSVVQEAMKGFPQGIPDVAQSVMQGNPGMQGGEEQEEFGEEGQEEMAYGGIPKYQDAGQTGSTGLNNTFQFLSPFTQQLVGKINSEAEDKRRREVANTKIPNLVMNPDGSYYYSKTQGEPETLYNTATGQRAPVTDPEYAKYMDLLKKYNSRTKAGQYYINNINPADAKDLARLATKFGFKRDAEGTAPGYRFIQGSTPGFTFSTPNSKTGVAGFFGGYTPDLYERAVVEDAVGPEAASKMSPLEIRKAYFKDLGVDISNFTDAQLSDTKKLYTNKNFFEKSFYPKFRERFGKDAYRPEMGDDMLIAAEHYDAFKARPKEYGVPVTGYKCQEGPNGRQVVASSYMDEQARVEAGAYLSADEAEKVCSETPQSKKGWRCLGLTVDKKPNLVFDELGTFATESEAAATCTENPEIFDYMTPDKATFWAAAQIPPKKYLPWRKNVPFEPGNVVFEDWRAKAAQRFANQYAAPSEQLAAYTAPQGFASNASFLAGQSAEGVGQDIAQVDARNIATANMFGSQERQRKDQYNLLNAMNAQDYWKDYVTTNQQFDNANRAYINNLVKAGNNAWNNRMNLGMLNAVNPVFKIDPASGRSYFKKGYATSRLPGYAAAAKSKGISELMPQYLQDKGASDLTFKQWYDITQGTTAAANPYASAQALLPMYNVLAQGNAYSPAMMQAMIQAQQDKDESI